MQFLKDIFAAVWNFLTEPRFQRQMRLKFDILRGGWEAMAKEASRLERLRDGHGLPWKAEAKHDALKRWLFASLPELQRFPTVAKRIIQAAALQAHIQNLAAEVAADQEIPF